MECPDCKTVNIPEALFCTGCGRPLKQKAAACKVIDLSSLAKRQPVTKKGSTSCSAKIAAKS